MRLIILLIMLLGSNLVYSQQSLPSLKDDNVYGSYINRNEMWLCTSLGFPIDIAYDAFQRNYTPDIGYFTQVVTGNPSKIIEGKENISGIFNVTGRSAGVYEFIFTSETNDFCGMNIGQQSVVRIYLVPDLRPFTVLSNLCGGETDKVNLLNYVPFEVKNFADSMGWKIDFYNTIDKKIIADPTNIQVGLKDVGTRKYSYRYNDSQGPMAGGLTTMKKVPVYCCEEEAIASINVKIHGDEVNIEDRKVSFCLESLTSVPQNVPLMHLNLMSFLGVQAKNGKWELNTDVSVSALVKLDDAQNGLVTIKLELAKDLAEQGVFSLPLKLDCKYSFEDCDGVNHTATLLIEITDKLANIVTSDTKTVCRNLTSGSIDLDTYFEFYVPTTAGSWFYKNSSDEEILMPTSSVYLDTLKAGSLYDFVYRVHPAVDHLCDLHTQVANFRLKIRDINNTAGGAANMCRDAYLDNSRNSVNLYSYIPGFDSVNVDYSKVTWYSCDISGMPNLVIDPSRVQNYYLLDNNDPNGNLNVRSFKYEYNSECGKVEGKFFLSVVDSLFAENYTRDLVICYTDDWASEINLNQIFGIAGLKGNWEFDKVNSPTDLPNDADIWDSPIFNAKKAFEYAVAIENKTEFPYRFKYSPKPEECLTKDLVINIVVTEKVKEIHF